MCFRHQRMSHRRKPRDDPIGAKLQSQRSAPKAKEPNQNMHAHVGITDSNRPRTSHKRTIWPRGPPEAANRNVRRLFFDAGKSALSIRTTWSRISQLAQLQTGQASPSSK